MKTIPLTERVRGALDSLTAAEREYVPGRDPSSDVDIHKIRLADAVVEAVGRAERLPARSSGIVYVKLQRVRRKPA